MDRFACRAWLIRMGHVQLPSHGVPVQGIADAGHRSHSSLYVLGHGFAVQIRTWHGATEHAARADALRYLPGNVSVASVAGTFWNMRRESVATGFHMVPQPGSDALSPKFFQSHVIGAAPDPALQDATTTLMLEARPCSWPLARAHCEGTRWSILHTICHACGCQAARFADLVISQNRGRGA